MRTILLLVVLVGLGFVGVKAWQQHQETVKNDSGAYTCQGCLEGDAKARYLKENSGETSDGNSERKEESARVAAEKAVEGVNGPAIVTTPGTPSAGTSSMVPPADNSYTAAQAPVYVPTAGGTAAPPSGNPMDTQAPNAVNGQRFAGSGSYLVYRQGNITYRLDTSTGRSCVIYATMEEWHKPIVMSNGCGKTS